MSNISQQSIDQIKLSEAQEYYLELFRKWQKWQIESPEKLPEGYRSKDEFDFGILSKIFVEEMVYNKHARQYKLRNGRFYAKGKAFLSLGVSDEMIIFDKEDRWYVSYLIILADYCEPHFIFKHIYFEEDELSEVALEILIKNLTTKKFELHESSWFNNEIKLRLNILNRDNKITDLQNELELAQKTTIQPQQIFDFSSKIPKEYWEPFATYFSGFKSFIKRAKGKSLGMEININGDFMFRVYSDDPEDLVGIEQDLSDFLLAITYYSKNQFDSYQKMQNGETVSINNLVMEGKVSQLIQEVKYLELENKTLRTIVSIFPEILQNIQESIHQNYLQNQLLLEYYKPKIFTEGKTDVDYLKTAIKIFGKQYPELLKVEIEEIGIQEDGQTRDGGVPNLNAYFKSNKNKTSNLSTQIVLLYDCDTNQKLENIDNKLFKVGIKPNNYNQKYKIGIENLLPQSYFETDYYYHNIVKPNEKTGGTKIIIELDKVKLCQDICSKERLEDFKNFEELLSQLNQIIIQ